MASNKRKSVEVIGFKRLESITKMDPVDSVLSLTSETSGFQPLLESQTIRPDLITLVLKAMVRIFNSECPSEFVRQLLSMILDSSFLKFALPGYLAQVLEDNTVNGTRQTKENIKNALSLLTTIITKSPCNWATLHISFSVLKSTIEQLAIRQVNPINEEEISEKLKTLETLNTTQNRKQEAKEEQKTAPNDFREISILPTVNDIHTTVPPFLRKSKVHGEYADLNEYLDVQFRLMREDFVSPLRRGIKEIVARRDDTKRRKRYQEVWVYENVRVISQIYKPPNGICLRLSFAKVKIHWGSSKRLVYGSMLCLSNDGFETLHFATVAERKISDLIDGFVEVHFEIPPGEKFDVNGTFQMAETMAFFEAYKHVLTALQQIKAEDLPFQQYIVKCENSIHAPMYMNMRENPAKYNFDSLVALGQKGHQEHTTREVNVCEFGDWPTPEQMKLDDSQHRAMQLALTKEFVIIQGPPGTGKTHVGLKIVDVLLRNKIVWSEPAPNPRNMPILIVCYTNHALDQFLEGIISQGHKNMVRVGSRSKSDLLEQYSLKVKRRMMPEINYIHNPRRRRRSELFAGMKRKKAEIDHINAKVMATYSGIVSLNRYHIRVVEWLDPCLSEYLDIQTRLKEPYSRESERGPDNRRSYDGDYLEEIQWRGSNHQNGRREMNCDDEHSFRRKRRTFDGWSNDHVQHPGSECDPRGHGLLYDDRNYKEWGRRNKQNIRERRQTSNQWDKDKVQHHSWYDDRLPVNGLDYDYSVDKKDSDIEDVLENVTRRMKSRRSANRDRHSEWGEPDTSHILAKDKGRGCMGEYNEDATEYPVSPVDDKREEGELEDENEDAPDTHHTDTREVLTASDDEAVYMENERRPDVDVSYEQDGDAAVDDVSDDSVSYDEYLDLELIDANSFAEYWEQDQWLEMIRDRYNLLTKRIQILINSDDKMDEEEAQQCLPEQLNRNDRWRLYSYWIDTGYRTELLAQVKECDKEYESFAKGLGELNLEKDFEILRNTNVIGMTTTCAARYQSILRRIQPKIIIIEEAAEVLEAHIVTTLSQGCEHLILIGDHKQLRPKPTDFNLERNYNLGVSMFERMINNDMPYECLQLQHRMRPEIKDLLADIYPDLKNHPSVLSYPNVKGVSKNMFFINHKELETINWNKTSKENLHEANYVVALCKYLLQQGYTPNAITILTLYSGQMFAIRRSAKDNSVKVRVCVVDNYQGEENDIIILSLVRSNDDDRIGFLNVDNRVCVALSRAKIAFYAIGNIEMLANNSDLWRNLLERLKKTDSIGDHLELCCQNHPKEYHIEAKTAKDFQKAPEGGCSKMCEVRLQCGHTCPRFCHIDGSHDDVQCVKWCQIKCKAGLHLCRRKCCEPCDHNPSCRKNVEKHMPGCGHAQVMPCFNDPKFMACKTRCEKKLSCGHQCQNKCGMFCTTACKEPVEVNLKCNHRRKVACYLVSGTSDEIIRCDSPCEEILDCGHICPGACGTCIKGRLHQPCSQPCGRILVCGHTCKSKCSSKCPPCEEPCPTRCKHNKCDKLCGEKCTPCMELCEWRCKHYACGKPCSEPCDRPKCMSRCDENVFCGKCTGCFGKVPADVRPRCIGACGERCIEKCRMCDDTEITEVFFGTEDEPKATFVELEDCGHIFEITSLDKWIDDSDQTGNSAGIQYKLCPKCKTPIRKNLRYGDSIKKMDANVEMVKDKILGGEKEMKVARLRLATVCTSSRDRQMYTCFPEMPQDPPIICVDSINTKADRITMDARCQKLRIEIKRIIKEVDARQEKGEKTPDNLHNERFRELSDELKAMMRWVRLDRYIFSEKEVREFNQEMRRAILLSKGYALDYKASLINSPENDHRGDIKNDVIDVIQNMNVIDEDAMEDISKRLEDLEKKISPSGLGISDLEKRDVIAAMGFKKKGHWYKCPQGHIYSIGDCGGATEEAKCPECDTVIGGSSHRLRQDNTVATEMDGANHSAWSEQANMMNYQEFA